MILRDVWRWYGRYRWPRACGCSAAFIEAGALVVGIGSRVGGSMRLLFAPCSPMMRTNDFTLVAADALDEASVASAVQDARARHGRLDILVNGIGGYHAGEPVS